MSEPCYVGMDLGGTNARAAVVTPDGQLLSVVKRKVMDSQPEALAKTLAEAVDQAVAEAKQPIAGYGIGVPGQVRGSTGLVLVAPNLGWRNVAFGSLLSQHLGHPVRVVNDLSAAALGEVKAGAAIGALHVLLVFVGSGVGSAVVAHGQLLDGAGGVAGELGHTKVVRDGRLCGCGASGCLEAYVGGHNLIAQMKEKLSAPGVSSKLHDFAQGDFSKLNAGVLEKAALEGDRVAEEIYEPAAGFLAMAVANQVTMLNPSHVILGGGVLENCPGLRERIAAGIAQYSTLSSREGLVVTPSGLSDHSGLVGAALGAATV